jgi:hypothetical protein
MKLSVPAARTDSFDISAIIKCIGSAEVAGKICREGAENGKSFAENTKHYQTLNIQEK